MQIATKTTCEARRTRKARNVYSLYFTLYLNRTNTNRGLYGMVEYNVHSNITSVEIYSSCRTVRWLSVYSKQT